LIKLRRANIKDLDNYLALQKKVWSDNAVDKETAIARFENCPDGILIAEDRGVIIGTTTLIMLDSYDFDNPKSWYDTTDYGRCSTHSSNGKVGFGVDLSGTFAAADALLFGCMQIIISAGLEFAVLGGRMPGYSRYLRKYPGTTAETYLFTRRSNGDFRDPEVRMYSKIPGLNPMKTIPDYFDDPDSCDYGVLLRWKNPFYNIPGKRKIISRMPLAAYQMSRIWQERRAFWLE
jgi:hypothetical protein